MTSAILILLLGPWFPAAPPAPPHGDEADTCVVCAPALRDAIRPWIEFRESQGHRIVVVTGYQGAEQIRAEIRRIAAHGNLRSVLLVGDVRSDPVDRGTHLPTYLAPARINTAWGSEKQIATDNWFADLDDDWLPDLSMGRLPAHSVDDLAVMVEKILTYERSKPSGMWQRRVHLVAGVGGFGLVADAILETATRTLVRRGIPSSYRTKMTYASWRSPYCPDPRLFRHETIGGINEGCLCWVYIGHGFRHGLDWVRVPVGVAPIMRIADVDHIQCASGPPIAVFLSCYGAAFDGQEDCLAERMLAQPAGPIAVIGGTRMTMPYGMTVLSQALMHQMFRHRPATLGEMLMNGKRETLAAEADRGSALIDALARAVSPNPDDLEGERREHVLMFHLLGDPLLRVQHPSPVEVRAPATARPGQPLTIQCRSSIVGRGVVELTCRRGRFTFKPEPRTEFDGTHRGMQALTDVYRRANDDRYVTQSVNVTQTQFETIVKVPEHAEGPCAVRVFLEDRRSFAIGAALLYVAGE